MVIHGQTLTSSVEEVEAAYPEVHWSIGRVTQLYDKLLSDKRYNLIIVDNIPVYEELEDE